MMPVTLPTEAALQRFLAPTTRHTRRVEIYEQDGETRWEHDSNEAPRLKAGSISVDYDRDERRAFDLVLSNTDGVLVNAPGGFWYDKIIKAYRGVRLLDGTTWETQVGEFMIDRISEPHFPHEMRITGRDYAKKCMNSKYAHATQFDSGDPLETYIAAIAGAAGITKRILPVTGVTVGRTFFFDRGVTRWEAMKEMATAYSFELYFDAAGYLVMRPFNDPASTVPIIYLHTGKEGQLASYEKSTSDSRIYNHILVTGESSDTNILPVYAEVLNTNPNSPTSISELGDRLYTYTSSFIETQQQADELAETWLAVHSLEEFELSFDSLLLPWLDAGDVIGWVDPNPAPGDPSTFLLSSLTIPMSLGPMSGLGRRVTNVGA